MRSVSSLGLGLISSTELVGEYLDRLVPFDAFSEVTEVAVWRPSAPSVVDSKPSFTTLLLEEQVLQLLCSGWEE